LAKSNTRHGGRSAFRDEFYNDVKPAKTKKSASERRAASKRRKSKASIFLPLIGLFFLLCLIAVLGSSAMIWLRKLGAFFGVEFSGDL
jgi:hypothetical protein